ncbi:MAG: alpha/beta fold hydrolase [Gemmatimonadaceae bacterium]
MLPAVPARRGRLAPAECYPATDDRVTARFVRLLTGERVRIVTAGPASAPPVVLVHGWACSVYSWRHQLPALAAAGFHAVAIDLRGHGLSDMEASDDLYTSQAMAEFLVRTLDALELDRVALVGHSLGAAIAARLAMRQPARVARLAVISGVGFGRAPFVRLLGRIPDGLVRPFLPMGTSRMLFRLVLRSVAGGPGRYTSRDVDEYWAPTQFPEFVPGLWRLVRQHDWDTLDEAERASLRLPLLALFGGRDRLIGHAGPPSGGGWPEMHLLTGVGHAGHEEAPTLVNALLLPFLEPWRSEAAAGAAPPGDGRAG